MGGGGLANDNMGRGVRPQEGITLFIDREYFKLGNE